MEKFKVWINISSLVLHKPIYHKVVVYLMLFLTLKQSLKKTMGKNP